MWDSLYLFRVIRSIIWKNYCVSFFHYKFCQSIILRFISFHFIILCYFEMKISFLYCIWQVLNAFSAKVFNYKRAGRFVEHRKSPVIIAIFTAYRSIGISFYKLFFRYPDIIFFEYIFFAPLSFEFHCKALSWLLSDSIVYNVNFIYKLKQNQRLLLSPMLPLHLFFYFSVIRRGPILRPKSAQKPQPQRGAAVFLYRSFRFHMFFS